MSRLQVIKGGSDALGLGLADFLWVSDVGVTFKKKVILVGKDDKGTPVPLLPRWTFDEDIHLSNCPTHQSPDWDCTCGGITATRILVPCFFLPDPTRPQPNYLVLCEVRDAEDKCLEDDYRGQLRKALARRGPAARLVWFGFEQDYQLHDVGQEGSPGLAERRFLTSERHLGACFDAGLLIHSAWNPAWAETCEFKVGYRGFPQDLDPDPPSALVVADHLVVAHYLMEKVGAEKGLYPHWKQQAIFISTAALREPGDWKTEAASLMRVLAGDGRTLRRVPHPVNGGCQCIEVTLSDYSNPYKLALDVLEAVWPLEAALSEEQPEEDQE